MCRDRNIRIKRTFSKVTLDSILETAFELYEEGEDTTNIEEAINYAKDLYSDEISLLEDETKLFFDNKVGRIGQS